MNSKPAIKNTLKFIVMSLIGTEPCDGGFATTYPYHLSGTRLP